MSILDESRVPLQGAYTVSALRELVSSWRLSHNTVALVPTMGKLHEGHLSLMRRARDCADRVVCSIFVNPTQFGPEEDFTAYPRTLAQDEALLAEQGLVHLIFAPEEKDMYPFGVENAVKLGMPDLSMELCGANRPGHFNGVASVVLRFINLVSPDVLVLGEKDYQQLILLKRMVRDLQLPVQVSSGIIHREPDGLAMSTRNQYLSLRERQVAPRLHKELERLSEALKAGYQNYQALETDASAALESVGFKPEYVEVRRSIDLSRPSGLDPAEGLIVMASAWVGRTRLIDNVQV
jgi:pantoate--beta-alanine ligase